MYQIKWMQVQPFRYMFLEVLFPVLSLFLEMMVLFLREVLHYLLPLLLLSLVPPTLYNIHQSHLHEWRGGLHRRVRATEWWGGYSMAAVDLCCEKTGDKIYNILFSLEGVLFVHYFKKVITGENNRCFDKVLFQNVLWSTLLKGAFATEWKIWKS